MKKLVVAAGVLLSLVVVLVISLPTIAHKAGLHPEYTGPLIELPPGKRALVITTSHSVLAAPGETEGPATGVMASEMTHPYYAFLDAGMDVDDGPPIAGLSAPCRSNKLSGSQRRKQKRSNLLLFC